MQKVSELLKTKKSLAHHNKYIGAACQHYEYKFIVINLLNFLYKYDF